MLIFWNHALFAMKYLSPYWFHIGLSEYIICAVGFALDYLLHYLDMNFDLVIGNIKIFKI